jgi:hypothetical protein
MKRIVVVILLGIIAIPLLAQARHQVAKIDIRSRIPAKILMTQSALAEDRSYTDAELELAMSRLRRLSFVYAAHYTLDGTTLVVDVADENHFFFDFDLYGQSSTRNNPSSLDAGLGGRTYFQPGGVFQGSVGGVAAGSEQSLASVSAQYSHYGIAGTRAFASVAITRALGGVFGDSDIEPHLIIGYPLSLSQTVSLVAFHQGFHDSQSFAAISRPLRLAIISNTFELHWTYDTTNDPLFMTRGRTLTLFPSYAHQFHHFEGFSIHTIQVAEFKGSETGWNADFRQFRTLGARTVLLGELSGRSANVSGANTFEDRAPFHSSVRSSDATALVLLAHNFFDATAESETRRRIEGGVGYTVEKTDGRTQKYELAQLGYVYRNHWGAVHLTAVVRTLH